MVFKRHYILGVVRYVVTDDRNPLSPHTRLLSARPFFVENVFLFLADTALL